MRLYGEPTSDPEDEGGEGLPCKAIVVYICMYCGEVESYSGATLPFLPRSPVSREVNIENCKILPPLPFTSYSRHTQQWRSGL